MFLQNFQKFQKLCYPVLATWLRVNPVACPQSRAYLVGLRNSLAGQGSSREKGLENFQKIWVFRLLTTQFGNLFTSGSFSCELTQKFSHLPHDFLAGGTSSHEKYLDKFFKNFVSGVSRLVLATCTRLGTVTKNACFAVFG